jgi:hypothetical protein
MKLDATKWGFIDAMRYNERGPEGCSEWLLNESGLSLKDIYTLSQFVNEKSFYINDTFFRQVRDVSDDGWFDVCYQIVANGKEFFESITLEKIQHMIDNDLYTESFAYSFHEANDRYFEHKRAIAQLKDEKIKSKPPKMIREKHPHGENVIDLTGPAGNAFALIGYANRLANQLGKDSKAITEEMTSGDYENLIKVFEREFGDFVILER